MGFKSMNLAVITWAGSVAENQRDAKTESWVILYRDWEMGRNQEKIKKKKKTDQITVAGVRRSLAKSDTPLEFQVRGESTLARAVQATNGMDT